MGALSSWASGQRPAASERPTGHLARSVARAAQRCCGAAVLRLLHAIRPATRPLFSEQPPARDSLVAPLALSLSLRSVNLDGDAAARAATVAVARPSGLDDVCRKQQPRCSHWRAGLAMQLAAHRDRRRVDCPARSAWRQWAAGSVGKGARLAM